MRRRAARVSRASRRDGLKMSWVQGRRSVGAITWKPRAPAAYDPSPWMLIFRSAAQLVAVASADVHARAPPVLPVGVAGHHDPRAESHQAGAQQPGHLPGERRLRVPTIGRGARGVARLLEPAGRHHPVDLAREVVVAELVAGVDHDRPPAERRIATAVRRAVPEVMGRVGRPGNAESHHSGERDDRDGVPAEAHSYPSTSSRLSAQASADAMPSSRVSSARQSRSSWERSTFANAPTASPGRGGASASRNGATRHPLERRHQLADGDAVATTDVDHHARRADRLDHLVEALDRTDVRTGQVPDVEVVADAGAVTGRQIDAGDREAGLLPAGRHHQLAEHVRRLLGVDAGLEVGVGADRVEVAEHDRAEVRRRRHVLEDLLDHPLRPGVRRRRVERVVLADLEVVLDGVQRGRGREQHPWLAERDELVEQLQRLRDVVAVVLVRLLHRLGYDDPRGHVDRRVEVGVLLDDPADQVAVADVALVEDAVAHEHLRPGQQGVEHHRDVARGLERLGGGGAEVARPAGDQDLHPVRVAIPAHDADIVGRSVFDVRIRAICQVKSSSIRRNRRMPCF